MVATQNNDQNSLGSPGANSDGLIVRTPTNSGGSKGDSFLQEIVT